MKRVLSGVFVLGMFTTASMSQAAPDHERELSGNFWSLMGSSTSSVNHLHDLFKKNEDGQLKALQTTVKEILKVADDINHGKLDKGFEDYPEIGGLSAAFQQAADQLKNARGEDTGKKVEQWVTLDHLDLVVDIATHIITARKQVERVLPWTENLKTNLQTLTEPRPKTTLQPVDEFGIIDEAVTRVVKNKHPYDKKQDKFANEVQKRINGALLDMQMDNAKKKAISEFAFDQVSTTKPTTYEVENPTYLGSALVYGAKYFRLSEEGRAKSVNDTLNQLERLDTPVTDSILRDHKAAKNITSPLAAVMLFGNIQRSHSWFMKDLPPKVRGGFYMKNLTKGSAQRFLEHGAKRGK